MIMALTPYLLLVVSGTVSSTIAFTANNAAVDWTSSNVAWKDNVGGPPSPPLNAGENTAFRSVGTYLVYKIFVLV